MRIEGKERGEGKGSVRKGNRMKRKEEEGNRKRTRKANRMKRGEEGESGVELE